MKSCLLWLIQSVVIMCKQHRLSHVLIFFNPHAKSYVYTCSALLQLHSCDDFTGYTYSRLHGFFACFCHSLAKNLVFVVTEIRAMKVMMVTTALAPEIMKEQVLWTKTQISVVDNKRDSQHKLQAIVPVIAADSVQSWIQNDAESGADGERRVLSWIQSAVLGMVLLQPC